MFELGISLVSMIIGFVVKTLFSWYKNHKQTSGQSVLFKGLERSTIFVYPPRDSIEEAILPRISIEDFMAINNIISAYINMDWAPPEKLKDSKKINETHKKDNNLILICSSKTNKITGEALELLKKSNPEKAEFIPSFEYNKDTRRTSIKWGDGTFESKSWDQKDKETKDDIAIILKAQNPWTDRKKKILIVAGIRGIGTWGAAEYLKKWWQPLYDKKKSSKSKNTSNNDNFVALVKVKYENYDIKKVQLLHYNDLT